MNQRILTLTCHQNPWNLKNVPDMLTFFWLSVILVCPRAVATVKELKLAQHKEVSGSPSSKLVALFHNIWLSSKKSERFFRWITWMIEVRRNRWNCLVQLSLLKAGSSTADCSCVQLCFEYFQGWRLQKPPGQPVPLDHFSLIKTLFPLFQCTFLYFSLGVLLHVLWLGATEKSLAPSSLLPPIRYLYTCW